MSGFGFCPDLNYLAVVGITVHYTRIPVRRFELQLSGGGGAAHMAGVRPATATHGWMKRGCDGTAAADATPDFDSGKTADTKESGELEV